MKAYTYIKQGKFGFTEKEKPTILDDHDAIVRVTLSSICTSDDIKLATSMPRNMFLFSNAIYLLPYTGVGSGITRALDEDINVTFTNNASTQEFVITVWREESNQVEEESNQVEDLETRLRHSDTPKVSESISNDS